MIFARQQIEPRRPDAVSSQQSIGDLSDRLAGHVALDGGQFAERDVGGALIVKGSRAQADAGQRLTGLADLVHGLVGGNLGLIVRSQNAKIDLFVVLVPLSLLPPGSTVAAGAVV